MNFLRTVLILILLYYGFKLLTRTLLPYFAKKWVDKAQENYKKQQGFVDPDEARKHEGEVKVESRPNNQKSSNSNKDDLGDYIDFEEIKEK